LFRRATGTDAAAETRQSRTGTSQSREQVLELSELHLPLAFPRACPPRKDVEDQLRAIDHFAVEALFELTELSRAQFVVENHHVDIRFVARGRERTHLAGSDERCRIGLGRSCSIRNTTRAPAASARPASSSSE
jgi:hypothetical protein